MKKNLWTLGLIATVLLTGCMTLWTTPQEEAAAVPRLTKVMHVLVRQGNYSSPTNLPPTEIKALYAKAVEIEPVLKMFKNDVINLRWSNGEVDILICNPRGTALFEDISCTAILDKRGNELKDNTFSICHPETCGCKKKRPT
jgi:hypothetical protein